jgi:hypothetical protein
MDHRGWAARTTWTTATWTIVAWTTIGKRNRPARQMNALSRDASGLLVGLPY